LPEEKLDKEGGVASILDIFDEDNQHAIALKLAEVV